MTSQHWFRYWVGAVRQQIIAWANVDPDLWRHMALLDNNVLIQLRYADTKLTVRVETECGGQYCLCELSYIRGNIHVYRLGNISFLLATLALPPPWPRDGILPESNQPIHLVGYAKVNTAIHPVLTKSTDSKLCHRLILNRPSLFLDDEYSKIHFHLV